MTRPELGETGETHGNAVWEIKVEPAAIVLENNKSKLYPVILRTLTHLFHNPQSEKPRDPLSSTTNLGL